MLVHALEYLIITAAGLLLHAVLPQRLRWVGLVATGATFLGFVGVRDVAVALALTLVNWAAAIGIERWAETTRGTALLFGAVFVDVAVLALYKFGALLVPYAPPLASLFASRTTNGALSLLAPMGVSYYVFQLVGYCLEVHWGRATAERNPGKLAASVVFFPKLVAGPIERPPHFLPQLETAAVRLDGLRAGAIRVGWGVFKKAVIADRIGALIDPIYRHPQSFDGLTLLLAVGLYTVQVYNDFSGYTDIALGTAKLFGFDLLPNFDHPFRSKSITEFWRRWHMSLSSWTSDYIYRPLSIWLSFKTSFKRAALVVSIVLTFAVLGVWHGASWTFVAFGLVHGVAVSFEALTQKVRFLPRSLPPAVADVARNVLTVVFYSASCVLFRAESVSDALYILTHAFTRLHAGAAAAFVKASKYDFASIACILAVVALVGWLVRRRTERAGADAPRDEWWRVPLYLGVVGLIVVAGVFEATTLVYAQF